MESFEQQSNFKEKAEELIRLRKEKITSALDSGNDETAGRILDKIASFSSNLMSKYPDYSQYLAWHILSGSTPDGELEKGDFPGEDSIERFIREEL